MRMGEQGVFLLGPRPSSTDVVSVALFVSKNYGSIWSQIVLCTCQCRYFHKYVAVYCYLPSVRKCTRTLHEFTQKKRKWIGGGRVTLAAFPLLCGGAGR